MLILLLGIITAVLASIYVFIVIKSRVWSLVDSFTLGVFFYQLGSLFLLLEVGENIYSVKIASLSSFCFIVSIVLGLVFRVPAIISASQYYPSNIPISRIEKCQFWLSYWFVIITCTLVVFIIFFKFSDLIAAHYPGFLLDIRKQISSGERGYMWPGLIKQLRDILGPIVIAYMILYVRFSRPYISLIFLLGVVIAAVLMGGQRFPVVVIFCVLTASFLIKSNKSPVKILASSKAILGFIAALFFLSLLNILLSRSDTSLAGFIGLFGGLIVRVIYVVPYENYQAMAYLEESNFPFCYLWLSELSSLIPGVRFTLSNELHQFIGGSSEGNSTFGAALSGYYNAGYIGIFLFVGIIMALLSVIDWLSQYSRMISSLKIVLLFLVPMWYSFFLMMLNGGLVAGFLISLFIGYRFLKTISAEVSYG